MSFIDKQDEKNYQTDFVKQQLKKKLPNIVWIGETNEQCQPAYLRIKDDYSLKP